jgi:type IV pilus assembly protein PilQ
MAGTLSCLLAFPSIGVSLDLVVGETGVVSADAVVRQEAGRVLGAGFAHTLTNIDVQQEADSVNIVISGDGNLRHHAHFVGERRLVVDVHQVASALSEPVLAVNHRLLKQIRLGTHADRVRVVLDLADKTTFSVEPQAAAIIVHLKQDFGTRLSGDRDLQINPAAVAVLTRTEETRDVFHMKRIDRRVQPAAARVRPTPSSFSVRTVQMTSDTEGAELSTPKEDIVLGETRYVGRRISLDFQQADISNVLRLIAEVSGFNIVVGEGVKSKVTMKLVSVPWDQALDMILKMNGLGKIKQGNILWIDSLANIARQQDEEARAKDAKIKAETLVDRVFYIRNLQAQELLTSLRQNLSPRGTMQVSPGTNALIVRDTESKMSVLKQLIDGLDLAVPQVQIEARIVQADTTYSRSLGVQWGVQNINQLGPSFGVANFKSGTTGTFGNQTSDFLVNLPAAVGGLVSTPGMGFTFGRTDGALLDVRLSAGELLGLSKVIAAPKVTTLDKREAKISQGESIPFQTTSLQGTQTTFVDANLELNVTPQITSRDPKEVGKQILMKVRATRNAVGARSNPAGPSIDRREANTQVIIRDGETMVIGGVFIDAQNNNVAGVPYLSRVPVLGWLFKQKTEAVAKQELLIFLTPTIVKS